MSGPFKMKGWSPFTQKEFKLKSEKEGENAFTKPKGSYSDKDQNAIDELHKRMTAYENRPK